ncbi:MAG: adaptor protein MecA [Ruminococcaceae bacterium]|nr:adaptor protein MecA [Oscillospiraceae bacterium]
MQIEITDNGCLTLMLSDDELSAMGLCFEQLDRRDAATRRMLRTLLQIARRRTGFSPEGPLSVEALPTADGCLLLVTPLAPCNDKPLTYRIPDENALLQIAAAWPHKAHPWGQSSSLYRTADGFRLILYGVAPFAALAECADRTDEQESYIAEHGTPWFVGDALPQLCSCLQ